MDRPPPSLSQFVLKMHSRCDLACDHCYVYEHADTSWRGRPRAVTRQTLARAADRIAEHALAHGLPVVHVVLHGGEPLLAGPELIRCAAEELTRALDGISALDLRIHTNGVLLSEDFCDLFAELGVKVGVSLDGDRVSNDRHRRYADGRTSHPQVLRAVALLNRPGYRRLFAGLLCTIDVENDPVAVYDALVALDPPRIDFLLPHATWDVPPPRPHGSVTPYADWLDVIYRRWDAAGRPVPVRIFDSVLRTLRGESSLTESLGLAPADLVVIETDGTFEQADSLKTAYDAAPATGMNLVDHTLDEVLAHPGMLARQQGLEQLADECRACPVVDSCGGGLYAHRYRTGSGFLNPSVFCPDLMELIVNIRDREAATAVVSGPEPLDEAGLGATGLDELASGFGSDRTVARLVAAQAEINHELLAAVGERAPRTDRTAMQAWELLVDIDACAPEALDAVLAHPYTRPWALGVLRDGTRRDAAAPGLAEIAAAAVLRARRGDTVAVPVREGLLRLPGLGSVALPPDAALAEVTADAEGFSVRAAGRRVRIDWEEGVDGLTPYWQPVRVVERPGWSVALEDTDPLRDRHQWPVAPRLSAGEAKLWAQDLAEAWTLIQDELPGYAPGVATGLRVVTPLHAPGGSDVSAASRDAFGAIGAARPDTPELLALLIVHEFQHVKLGAVLDSLDLHHPDDGGRLFYAPWRPDPRPLDGLLQGTYAHIAVTDFWRVRRHTAQGALAGAAEARFARWREQTTQAVEVLAGSGLLTPLGERFVAGMRGTAETWETEEVSAAALARARDSAGRHRADWIARNPVHGAQLRP
ncbi:FxsB family cyclophane-forming radical SAM/SPASM peptide maturase [Streptomyces sp. NBC_00338]|uniref:FxsB family cyclophane-forming radical SAM/SPASM peptide maturase n=1 Tax=Streptomyces sp. NBC_00338 TaxID=2975715 RepID=UPI002259C6D6|nr:FxsB family cyclophane-forming radical SAM/SPASM peptide maturase [Streptomyces sp. NBC_00338]MCX5138746.1 FxsB family radical SAM/SPASM domain protein [Streptomyces sp. NBC_00338]